MRHKIAGRSLSRATGHRKALYRNLVTDLSEARENRYHRG